jgi:hypothetical protein
MWTKTNNIEDLTQGVMTYGPDILELCMSNDPALTQYVERIAVEHLPYPLIKTDIDKENWFIPYEYKTMDILDWLYQR